jgi:hypothetical protein
MMETTDLLFKNTDKLTTVTQVHKLQSGTGTKQDLRFRSRTDWFVSVVVVGEFFWCGTTDDDEVT